MKILTVLTSYILCIVMLTITFSAADNADEALDILIKSLERTSAAKYGEVKSVYRYTEELFSSKIIERYEFTIDEPFSIDFPPDLDSYRLVTSG